MADEFELERLYDDHAQALFAFLLLHADKRMLSRTAEMTESSEPEEEIS